MRTIPVLGVAFLWVGLVLASPGPAHADDVTEPTVAVPDVRGLTMAEAFETLQRAGLRAGPVERTNVDELARVLRRRYETGVVVEQAPLPFERHGARRVAEGSRIALRVSSLASGGPMRPLIPGGSLPPPYDPSRPEWVRRPIAPPPSVPPRPTVPPPTRTVTPRRTTPTPPPPARTLSRAAFFVRPVGGYAFSLGADAGDPGWYGGVDVGRRFVSGFGVSAFYRYARSSFDRLVPGGWFEDSGDWHHVGLKAEYETRPLIGGRVSIWAGLGGQYAVSDGYLANGDGFGGFAELGLGVRLSRRLRARLGANVHGVYTDAVRRDPADDGRRLLWTLAPVLAVELDF